MTTYFHLLVFLLGFFQSTSAGEPYGVALDGLAPGPASTELTKRSIDGTYIHDITWQVLDDALFSVDFDSTQGNSEEVESITLECLDCWTTGTINATMNSSTFDTSAMLSVEFKDVRASFDMALLVNVEQTLRIPIYRRSVRHTGDIFDFDVDLAVDIVFRLDQSVNLTGGFQVIIPNTAYITVHMGVEFSDLDRPIFTVNHDFNGTQINPLPLAVDESIGLTASLKASIDIDGGINTDLIQLSIGGGLYLIPAEYNVQLTIDESQQSQQLEAVESFDMNFGYYYGGSVSVDHIDLSRFPFESTTFLKAGPWTQTIVSTNAGAEPTSVPLVEFTCPNQLSTITALTTKKYTAYKCLITVPNCPPAFEQTIVATHIEEVSSVICPSAAQTSAAAAMSTSDPPVPSISPGPILSPIQMTQLASAVVNSLSLPNTTPSGFPPNITAQFLPIIVTTTAVTTTTTSAATNIVGRIVITPLLSYLCVVIIVFLLG